MSGPRSFLTNRAVLVCTTLFCLLETWWAWSNVARGVNRRADLDVALFSLVLTLPLGWSAYKSQFWADRIVLAILSVVSALVAIRGLPLRSTAMLGVHAAQGTLWAIAASASIFALTQSLLAARRDRRPV